MAQEITVTLKMSVAKGYLVQKFEPGTILVDMSGTNAIGGVQNIGTTGEALTITDVSTAGYAFFRNTSTTISVDIGTGTAGSFVAFMRLKAGEVAICRLGTNAPTARSVSSTVDLQFFILAD